MQLVDAFTRTPGEGNRAGVVLDASGLAEAQMQRIAKAAGVSETVFRLPAEPGRKLRLRYFTPTNEIDFCGHATVAFFHAMVEQGLLEAPGRFEFHCQAGALQADLEQAEGGARVWLTTPLHPWRPLPIPVARLLEMLGTNESRLDPSLPVLQAGPRIYIPLHDRASVDGMAPQFAALAEAGTPFGVHGYYVFTRRTEDPNLATHGRFFAPAFGVPEDPVTGSASGPLADYLVRQSVLVPPLRASIGQGLAMGKPGQVDLDIEGTHEAIGRIRIGGQAVTVLEGELR